MSTQVEAVYPLKINDSLESCRVHLEKIDPRRAWMMDESEMFSPALWNGLSLAYRYSGTFAYKAEVSWCEFLSEGNTRAQILERFQNLGQELGAASFIVFPNQGYEISVVEDLAAKGLAFSQIDEILWLEYPSQLLAPELLDKGSKVTADDACDLDGYFRIKLTD